jgi:hypothetical protein
VLRVVLGVALAAALLAATTPALDDARATRTERLAERELDRVARAAVTLASEEAPGARRTLTVSLPGDSPTARPLAVALGGVPDGEEGPAGGGTAVADTAERDVFAVRVAGGRWTVRRVEADLRASKEDRIVGDDRPLVLRGGETYAVTLRLRRLDGRRVVVVSVRSAAGGG